MSHVQPLHGSLSGSLRLEALEILYDEILADLVEADLFLGQHIVPCKHQGPLSPSARDAILCT